MDLKQTASRIRGLPKFSRYLIERYLRGEIREEIISGRIGLISEDLESCTSPELEELRAKIDRLLHERLEQERQGWTFWVFRDCLSELEGKPELKKQLLLALEHQDN
jgi:hypothetical protein